MSVSLVLGTYYECRCWYATINVTSIELSTNGAARCTHKSREVNHTVIYSRPHQNLERQCGEPATRAAIANTVPTTKVLPTKSCNPRYDPFVSDMIAIDDTR